jgi:protein SCO1
VSRTLFVPGCSPRLAADSLTPVWRLVLGAILTSGPVVSCDVSSTGHGIARADPAAMISGQPWLFQQPWVWRDDRGEVVTFSKWRGTPEVVTMFFRGCTLRCPQTLGKLRDVEAAFSRRKLPVHIVLVTLDPRNDTPDRLRDFKEAEHLSENTWHLLSGNDSATRELGRALGIRPSYDDSHIDHDVRIALFDSEGRLVRTFEGWHFDDEAMFRPDESASR